MSAMDFSETFGEVSDTTRDKPALKRPALKRPAPKTPIAAFYREQRNSQMETPEEKALRNDYVKTSVLQRVADGGVSHDVWVTRAVGLPDMQEPIDPVVELANDDDGHYVQVFRARSELEVFVAKLCAAADEAWPSTKTANVRVEAPTTAPTNQGEAR